MDSRCPLENNTLLHLDLPATDQHQNYYSSGKSADSSSNRPDTWVLVVAAAGGLCCVIVVVAIIAIACRLRKLSKEERMRQENVDHIHTTDKALGGAHGTDV